MPEKASGAQTVGPPCVGPSTGVLAAFGSTAFPLAAAFVALQVLVPTHYAEYTGLSLTAVGIILLLARLVDTVTDPLVGYASDALPLRHGRRKWFVVGSAPLVALATGYLFNPPAGAGAAYLLVWTVAIYVAGTLSVVPAGAWGAELSSNYHDRSRISGWRVAFGLTGTLTALMVPVVLGTGEASQAGGSFGPVLTGITWLVWVSLSAASLWCAWRVPDDSPTRLPDNPWRAAWPLIRDPGPFRQLLTSFCSNGVGNAIPATLFVLYVTHVLDRAGQVGPLLFAYFVCASLSVPVWVRLARHFGKHQVWSVAIVLACLFFSVAPFLGPDLYWVFVILVVATGVTTGADLALPNAINADLIEWDGVQTGYRRPGLFFALWGTATKLSYALAIGIAFPLLDRLGFDAAARNGPGELTALAWLYGAPAIGFKLLALWLMHGYPISEQEHDRLRAELARREALSAAGS